jgi:hypothetical protein
MTSIRLLSTIGLFLSVAIALNPALSLAQTAPAPAKPAAPAPAKPAPAKPAAAKPAAAKPAAAKPAPAPAKPAAAAPAGGDSQPTLLGKYGEWGAYTAAPGGAKTCFVIATPTTSQTNPANRPRDPAHFFISTRPSEKVKDEVSVIMGYTLKPSSEVTVAISPANFALYSQNDGAWIKNAADEARLVDALRKGSDAVVKGTSAKGTQTTDTFPLKGLAQALDRVGQECK